MPGIEFEAAEAPSINGDDLGVGEEIAIPWLDASLAAVPGVNEVKLTGDFVLSPT